jgi:proteasome lid subunit RPN8/RPN11
MSGDDLSLPRTVLDEIYTHAQEGYPEEVCGFLFGPSIEDSEARRCENRQNALHAEDPEHFPRDARTAYNFGPNDLMLLDRSLQSERPVRVIYHSHIDVGAYFSEEDARAALFEGELLYPVDYLVIDVRKDGVRGSKLFRHRNGIFVEMRSYGP